MRTANRIAELRYDLPTAEKRTGEAKLRNDYPHWRLSSHPSSCAEIEQAVEKVIEAAKEVNEWYERDGSVGGAVDPLGQLNAALSHLAKLAEGK